MTLPSSRTRSRTKTLVIAVALVLIVIFAASVLLTNLPKSPFYTGPKPYTQTVVDGTLNLGTSYYSANFSIPNGATVAQLVLNFTAHGGSGNDIKLHVLTADNLQKWALHQPYLALYETGQISIFNQALSVPSSGYYSIVFDNTFSFFSSKTVSARATLTYTL